MVLDVHFLLPYIQAKLKTESTDLFLHSGVSELGKGAYSKTYLVKSSVGKLVIHVVQDSHTIEQFQNAERRFFLSQFLKHHPKVPTALMITYGQVEDTVYTVQEYMPGKEIKHVKDEIEHLQHLAEIISYLHNVNLRGGGYLKFNGDKPEGIHTNWYLFLRRFTFFWFKSIYQYVTKENISESLSSESYVRIQSKLKKYFRKYKTYFEGLRCNLLHGDLSLGNILIDGKRVSALIDLDFSMVGDPAWDFAFRDHLHKNLLPLYFSEMRGLGVDIDEDHFRFRISLYEPIIKLAITNSLKRKPNINIKKDLAHIESMIDNLV